MDQKRIGCFLKELRHGKGITQEQLAERLGVSGRTVSRWETGSNMPDLDILIELADFYEVEIGEILDGERKSEKMNKDLEETVLKVADYSSEERKRLTKRMHIFFVIGVATFIVYMVLDILEMSSGGVWEKVADTALGFSFGMLLVGAIFTSRYFGKIRAFKMRLLRRK